MINGTSIDSHVAAWFGEALVAAMSKPKAKRAGALAQELNLAALNKRASKRSIDIQHAVDLLMPELSKSKAVKLIAEQEQISEASVWRYLRGR